MAEIDLLDRYPKSKRQLEERSLASEADKLLARQFGKEYFDGTRQQGLGGYHYNGWWKPVVQRFIEYYHLSEDATVLDVGCAKGFTLFDFKQALPACTVAGIDVSKYCLDNAMPEIKPYLSLGSCDKLPYPDKSFDLVISIATIHNLDLDGVKQSLREIERVKKKHAFIKVNGYKNEEERIALNKWNIVAKTILHCDEWKSLFKEVGYTGDYFWFTP